MLLPTISIVTPSLNQAAFLGEALASVREQQYPGCEHLVFDGGSEDGTVDLLRNCEASQQQALYWHSGPDAGQSDALNQGFSKASGDIIGWLNADDRYRPGCFDHVAKLFAQHPEIDIVYGDYTLIDEGGEHIALRREIEFSRFILRYHRVLYIPTTAAFFRRRIFDEGNYLSNSLHYAMDLEFFLRLSDGGYKFVHLPEVLADFRVHSGSKSIQFIDRQRKEHRSIVLQKTPLARLCRYQWLMPVAVGCLQLLAGAARYSEKFRRGFYFRGRGFKTFAHLPKPERMGL